MAGLLLWPPSRPPSPRPALPPLSLFLVYFLAACLSCLVFFAEGGGFCPNNCNGNGTCTVNGTCACANQFTGSDCSRYQCPASKAWVDYATATDTAHADTTCSNMGRCQTTANASYAGGFCLCRTGFEGMACERTWCPGMTATSRVACSGKGRCLSMKEAAVLYQYPNSVQTYTYTSNWDADKIMGCICDDGYTGFDCSLRTCPKGDDPETTGQVDEIQGISCICQTTCSGSFTLTFRGETTASIAHGASASDLETALEALAGLDDVTVSIEGGTTVCDNDGAASIVTFLTEHGDVPAFTYTSSLSSGGGTPAITITNGGGGTPTYGSTAAVTGTKEWVECSNRGHCDRATGQCTCVTNFAHSNGQGGAATATFGRADCGYESVANTACPLNSASPAVACNGQGTCSNTVCSCNSGYTGVACTLRTCATGVAWFDEPSSNDNAHASSVECSNRVSCREKGRRREDGTGLGERARCGCASGWRNHKRINAFVVVVVVVARLLLLPWMVSLKDIPGRRPVQLC